MLRTRNLAVLLLAVPFACFGQEAGEDEDWADPFEQTVPVADDAASAEAAATAEDADPAPPTEDAVLREFARFQQLLDEENYDEADTSAKRVVQMSIEIYGPQSHETAKALNNLAIVQHNNQQYDAAIQNFTSAIEILEIIEDRLNEQLVNPLRGLGAAQLGRGRPDLASRTLNRARHITHVNEGPHNIEQVEILESLAEAQVRLGDLEAARDVLDRIHILNVRHFRDDAMGLLPSLMRRASWQHRAGYYNDERATYRRAVRIIEQTAGREDPRLIDPLLRLGRSFYFFEPVGDGMQRPLTSSGELFFKRAVRIAETTPDFPWLERATTKLALADYYVVAESHNRARRIYKEVWADLSTGEDRIQMRDELMGKPVPVWEESLPNSTNAVGSGGSRATDLRTGTITATYTVSARGRVRVLETVADPVEFRDMQRVVHREIRRRAFRPQLVDGVPVEAENQVFRHEFKYREREIEEIRRENDAELAAAEKKT